jgi:carbamoyl-phosphate synthase large subunit
MPKRTDLRKILVIGSGPIVIGQAAEFDYSGSQACKSLREEGYEVVLVNSNPATIQTDPEIADTIYIEPLVPPVLAQILRKEKPDGILPTMGGQTGLNLVAQLAEEGVLEETGVEILGTPIEAIRTAEDRDLFARLMKEIGEPIPPSRAVHTLEEGEKAAEAIGYPFILRPAYTLGGTGGSVVRSRDELEEKVKRGLETSPAHQVLIEKSLLGWYEYEYEVMRDRVNTCITICNMENLDPMGVHTGESIVVAPAQTLSDEDHQRLRSAALKIIRALGIEGGCNIQFAVHPASWEYYVIEVNPRVSRSSALASKATGYPIAKISAKVAAGFTLDEIPNDVTKETPASFEPALDYVVTKIPRWPFDKFRTADRRIGTQMKSTGEVMGIGRTFEESLQKAIRSLDIRRFGLCGDGRKEETDLEIIRENLRHPTDQRIFFLCDALKAGLSVEELHRIAGYSPFFLHKLRNILRMAETLRGKTLSSVDEATLRRAKALGFSDRQLAHLFGAEEEEVRSRRGGPLQPVYKMVDTCAGEFEAKTPYYYSTYEEEDEARVGGERKKVLLLGGGPIRIAQGIEFDYCCVHGVLSLREEGIEAILVNNNPETVSTDYDTSDRLYFEPLTLEDVLNIVEKERPMGVIVQFGGQTSLNLAVPLSCHGVPILGTSPEDIDRAEDREKFTRLLKKLGIPQAEYGTGFSVEEAKEIASRIGYPVLVRPSYVLGGRAMAIVYDEVHLSEYIEEAMEISEDHPILIDKFLQRAVEVDVDAISDGKDIFIGGIMEHIEHAGIHSGDSACVLPPQTLGPGAIRKIKEYTKRVARELHVVGLLNIQYAVQGKTVYLLEANPRASRTVPYVSKAIGVPLAKIATKVMLGKRLRDLGYIGERKIRHVAVKEAVFPFAKLPGVDPVLGPEMKSTGEVMGIDFDFGRAYYKAQLAAGNTLPTEGRVFISVQKSDLGEVIPLARRLSEWGFQILATGGTLAGLEAAGISGTLVKKISEGRPNVLDMMRARRADLIINTPTAGKVPFTDGYYIRRYAVDMGIPYITTITGAKAAIQAIESIRKREVAIRSMDGYHRDPVHELLLEDFREVER